MSRYLENLSLTERNSLVDKSETIHTSEDADRLGLSADNLWSIFEQVSETIHHFNQEYPGDMLEKSPEEIYQAFEAGESTIIYAKDDNENMVFLYHGAVYPLLSSSENRNISWNVFELGSAIAPKAMRNMGLGTLGVYARADKVNQSGENSVALTTIKHSRTAHVWGKVGARPVSWHTHPYLATLTDVCSGINPVETGSACEYRRSSEDSTYKDFERLITDKSGGHTSCTLLVLDKDKASQYERWARRNHEMITQSRQPFEVDDRLDPSQFRSIATFYSLLRGNDVTS